MRVWKLMGYADDKTEVLGDIYSSYCHIILRKSHMNWPDIEHGPPR
jgi:hypothetical protein